jgi:CheY-like chemotaxis protein
MPKKVLVIDESSLFRNFIRNKLESLGLEVVVAVSGLDGSSKMRTETPDLIIMDYYLSRVSSVDLLEKKKEDPNIADVPVIMASSGFDRETVLKMARFSIRKFFSKPIKVDSFIKTVGEALSLDLEVDATPCIIEAHFNDDVLFIEVARGLNSEKIDLLKYKIAELLDLYEIKVPKVLLMMSSLEVTANDSMKLSSLLSIILEHTGVRHRYFKILTNSDYVRRYVSGSADYKAIEVVESLEKAMSGLYGRRAGSYMTGQGGVAQQEVLKADAPKKESSEAIHLRFQSEHSDEPFDLSALGEGVSVAVVDDDPMIRELIETVLLDTNFQLSFHENGRAYVDSEDPGGYDLLFLDLRMPEMDGFAVLERMKDFERKPTVIVLSSLNQRETVVRALKLGVTSYLTKPLDPDTVLKKTTEVLKTNF